MNEEEPMTVNNLIEVLQKIKDNGNGNLKIMHSFNTIHSISKEEIYNENFIVLKGYANES